jgi:Putative zinc- or iron-chelating domain
MTGGSRAERMQAIYDRVPPMADCKGHCWISCGPASMTPWERRRLALAGHKITPDELARKAPYDFWCEALGPDGRCRAYESRPLICRLWGAVDWLPCPHGCMPVGGWLPNDVAFRLLVEVTDLGGYGDPVDPEAAEKLKNPAVVAALAKEMAGKGAGDLARFRIYGAVLPVAITRRKPPGG